MQSTVNPLVRSVPGPQNWTKEGSVFTGDHLIDAYIKGKQDGKHEFIQILTRQLEQNISIAADAAEKLFDEAIKKQIKFKAIHLRADAITKFAALFITDKNDYVSDTFRDVFVTARKLKSELESDSFYISFLFMAATTDMDERTLISDGYFLKYEKKQ
ncbi:MAG: hypothetical protein MUF24_09075 [Chitinophagaceae bacterium]|jgi:hypothetical protein|nr:hypothetical protein [Chitinophagaceae bacterium]